MRRIMSFVHTHYNVIQAANGGAGATLFGIHLLHGSLLNLLCSIYSRLH